MRTAYLVDDDRLVLDEFCAKGELFLECGFEIAGAGTNPHDALEAIQRQRPDVVLADLKMPGMTGIELMDAVLREGNPPVFVIVSAYHDFRDVRRFFLSHGFDYLVKPVSDRDLADLLNRIAARLGNRPIANAPRTASHELNGILAYLKEYPAMKHSLESIGERYQLNPNTVCNLFAKHLNSTFTAFLTGLRMERAEALLLGTNKQVKEIAIESGYNDYFYFCRVFRERHGMSPTRYRETAQGG